MKILKSFILLVLALIILWLSYINLSGSYQLTGVFVAGIFIGLFIMSIKINSKNDRINSYKRELEKESISSDKSAAKVKVLESKISVLEKALENALNKNK